MNYLDFEDDIRILDQKIESLKAPYISKGITDIANPLVVENEKKLNNLLDQVYSHLTPYQITKVARHDSRPRTKDYAKKIFTDFIPLAGDRMFAEDHSVISGYGILDGVSVLVVGQEKGNNTESKIISNYGMNRPEGFRKIIRLMKDAERLNIPVITFIDTPGPYPTKGSEDRGQAESIAKLTEVSLDLKVPLIAVIIGEGSSNSANALAAANKVLMLEYSMYSPISPEDCAELLWKNAKKVEEAAAALKISAKDLLDNKIIDEIILEPRGGAHRDHEAAAINLALSIKKNLKELILMTPDELVYQRKNRFLSIGKDVLLPKEEFYKENIENRIQYQPFNWKLLFQNNIKLIYTIIAIVVLFILALIFS